MPYCGGVVKRASSIPRGCITAVKVACKGGQDFGNCENFDSPVRCKRAGSVSDFRSLATGDGIDEYVSIRNSMGNSMVARWFRGEGGCRITILTEGTELPRDPDLFLRSGQLYTALRRLARTWEAAPVRTGDGSSRQFTSRAQCTLFSIVQHKRTAFKSASGDSLSDRGCTAPPRFLAGFRSLSGGSSCAPKKTLVEHEESC